jgi:hypothetical protein
MAQTAVYGPTPIGIPVSDRKPEHLRARRNRPTTATVLPESVQHDVPPLPEFDRDWHPLTEAWWATVWEDPISSVWTATDQQAVGQLALLLDTWHWRVERDEEPGSRLSTEIAKRSDALGLTPIGRARLGIRTPRQRPGIRTQPSSVYAPDPSDVEDGNDDIPAGTYRARDGSIKLLPATFRTDPRIGTESDPRRVLGVQGR